MVSQPVLGPLRPASSGLVAAGSASAGASSRTMELTPASQGALAANTRNADEAVSWADHLSLMASTTTLLRALVDTFEMRCFPPAR